MIVSMRIDDMVSKLTRLLEGLRIGHSLMGNSAAYCTVQVVSGIRCMKIDLLMRVTGQDFPTFQPQAPATWETMCFLLALRIQGTAALPFTIQEMYPLKILNPKGIQMQFHIHRLLILPSASSLCSKITFCAILKVGSGIKYISLVCAANSFFWKFWIIWW